MTRDEAIEGLHRILGNYYRVCNEHLLKEIDVAEEINSLNMAIEALERKRGEWIQHVNEPSLWSCSICETVIYSEHEEDRLKFHKWCGCCGADMRGER